MEQLAMKIAVLGNDFDFSSRLINGIYNKFDEFAHATVKQVAPASKHVFTFEFTQSGYEDHAEFTGFLITADLSSEESLRYLEATLNESGFMDESRRQQIFVLLVGYNSGRGSSKQLVARFTSNARSHQLKCCIISEHNFEDVISLIRGAVRSLIITFYEKNPAGNISIIEQENENSQVFEESPLDLPQRQSTGADRVAKKKNSKETKQSKEKQTKPNRSKEKLAKSIVLLTQKQKLMQKKGTKKQTKKDPTADEIKQRFLKQYIEGRNKKTEDKKPQQLEYRTQPYSEPVYEDSYHEFNGKEEQTTPVRQLYFTSPQEGERAHEEQEPSVIQHREFVSHDILEDTDRSLLGLIRQAEEQTRKFEQNKDAQKPSLRQLLNKKGRKQERKPTIVKQKASEPIFIAQQLHPQSQQNFTARERAESDRGQRLSQEEIKVMKREQYKEKQQKSAQPQAVTQVQPKQQGKAEQSVKQPSVVRSTRKDQLFSRISNNEGKKKPTFDQRMMKLKEVIKSGYQLEKEKEFGLRRVEETREEVLLREAKELKQARDAREARVVKQAREAKQARQARKQEAQSKEREREREGQRQIRQQTTSRQKDIELREIFQRQKSRQIYQRQKSREGNQIKSKQKQKQKQIKQKQLRERQNRERQARERDLQERQRQAKEREKIFLEAREKEARQKSLRERESREKQMRVWEARQKQAREKLNRQSRSRQQSKQSSREKSRQKSKDSNRQIQIKHQSEERNSQKQHIKEIYKEQGSFDNSRQSKGDARSKQKQQPKLRVSAEERQRIAQTFLFERPKNKSPILQAEPTKANKLVEQLSQLKLNQPEQQIYIEDKKKVQLGPSKFSSFGSALQPIISNPSPNTRTSIPSSKTPPKPKQSRQHQGQVRINTQNILNNQANKAARMIVEQLRSSSNQKQSELEANPYKIKKEKDPGPLFESLVVDQDINNLQKSLGDLNSNLQLKKSVLFGSGVFGEEGKSKRIRTTMVQMQEQKKEGDRRQKVIIPKTMQKENILEIQFAFEDKVVTLPTFNGESEVALARKALKALGLPASQKNTDLVEKAILAQVVKLERTIRDSLDRLFSQKLSLSKR